MENNENKSNEFDDIILEKSNKSEKIKKILLRIIALVILFLVVMIVMKLINSSEETELESLSPSENLETTQTQNGFETMPITQAQNDSEDQFELLRRQIQGEGNATSNETSSLIPSEPLPSAEPTLPEPSETITPKTQETPKVAPKAEPKTEIKKVEKPKAEPKPTPKVEPKVEPKTADTKELFKDVNVKTTHSGSLETGIYVQIFSVSNLDQKSKELAAVKQKGYDYKLYKTNVNGKEITKVLIGPFNKNTIANELAKIRKEVAKDAFSFTLK